ncbi:MAG: hypothetical protein OXB97_08245 [Rhodospirillales bacterium]|nr:hypothetical protein [Rhodospirillales bacterium]
MASLALNYAGRLSIRASATELRSWDACLAEVERLRDLGEPRPPELDEWLVDVALVKRTPPPSNRNKVRDEAIYMVAHAIALLDPDISDRAAAKLAAERLKERYPDLNPDKARNAYRAMKRSYRSG